MIENAPGDIAEIRSNSDGDTWSFKRTIGPRFKSSVRLSPCGVDIDVGFFPTVLGVGLNLTPMDVGLSPMFFPIVSGVGLNPTPAYGRWVKSHVLPHCNFECWVKSHPLPPSHSK